MNHMTFVRSIQVTKGEYLSLNDGAHERDDADDHILSVDNGTHGVDIGAIFLCDICAIHTTGADVYATGAVVYAKNTIASKA